MFDPMEFEIDEPEKVVYVVGIGPGDVYYLTQEAQNVLEHADAICGYKLYLDLIEPKFPCEEYYSTGMTKEIDRCRWALEKANTGRRVVMVCSGDAGVYGMASPLLELAEDYPDVAVEVVPGLTAALSGGAVLGAPLAHDFCVISLSDRLTPWAVSYTHLDVYKRQIEGMIASVNQLTERFPLLNEFKAVQEGQVWCTTQSLFQQSMELADLIVDMNRVFTEGTPAASTLKFLTHVD